MVDKSVIHFGLGLIENWIDWNTPCPIHQGDDDLECTCGDEAKAIMLREYLESKLKASNDERGEV